VVVDVEVASSARWRCNLANLAGGAKPCFTDLVGCAKLNIWQYLNGSSAGDAIQG
jgi:acyl-CoA-binding protein